MSLSTPFIHRPVGTTLLTVAITLAGALGYMLLPVSPLPQVDFPTISGFGSLCRVPAPRRWPRPWPRRWSGSSAGSPASRK